MRFESYLVRLLLPIGSWLLTLSTTSISLGENSAAHLHILIQDKTKSPSQINKVSKPQSNRQFRSLVPSSSREGV
jgi:hypothetical protein